MSTIRVSVKGISKLEQYIADYVERTKKKTEVFAERLAEEGVDIARIYIVDYKALFTEELVESISYDKEESESNKVIFCVKASSEHAIFVEMGTGKVGAGSGYKGKLPAIYGQGGFGKDQKNHFFTTHDGKYGWIYYNEQYERYIFTEGMPSRPFMYETSLAMQQRVLTIAKEVFGDE